MKNRIFPAALFIAIISAVPVLAADESDSKTLLDMLLTGWSLSPVITAIFGIFTFGALFLLFHTILCTKRHLTVPGDLLRQVLDDIASGDIEAAQKRAAENPSLFARTVLPGLKMHDHPIERIHQAMEGAGRRAIGSLRQRVTYLANIGVISPMLGLLGTVFGLMKAFSVVGGVEKGFSKAMMMNSAIGQAMITTAFGLVVGIPAMGLYYLCMSRIGRVADEVEIAAEEVAAAIGEAK